MNPHDPSTAVQILIGYYGKTDDNGGDPFWSLESVIEMVKVTHRLLNGVCSYDIRLSICFCFVGEDFCDDGVYGYDECVHHGPHRLRRTGYNFCGDFPSRPLPHI